MLYNNQRQTLVEKMQAVRTGKLIVG